MGKIVLLVPREEMLCQAHNILQEKQYAIGEMRVIRTEDTVVEARSASAAGASILIARGLQAALIKQYTEIPVVEIVVSAQEMALLIIKAKQILRKDRPVIAVVGFKDMFCDMSYFDMIYDIELRTYYALNGSGQNQEVSLKEKSREAITEGVDLIIGGDTVVAEAKEAGIPSLFLSITEESLKSAFAAAEAMDYAMGMEKKSTAQIETILDYSFSGVIGMDGDGRISSVNPVMEDILDQEEQGLKGRGVTEVFPELTAKNVKEVLEGREENYSCFVQVNREPVFAVLAPVRVGAETAGAVLTCHKVRRQRGIREENDQSSYHGLLARGNFNLICQESRYMQACVHLARLYAQAEQPVLILGETGTEKRLLAESIHNTSMRSEGGFAAIALGGLSADAQQELIFGEKGAAFLVKNGTLYLEDIELMSQANQYALFQLIRYKIGNGRDFTGLLPLNVRLIVSSSLTSAEFQGLVSAGSFRRDLYYELHGLVLTVPAYRVRPEDLRKRIQYWLRKCCEQYTRYHVLTEGGMKCLMEYGWPGNGIQLESFMKRLVLTAGKRTIDEVMIRKLMDELYPVFADPSSAALQTSMVLPLRSEEEIRIRTTLQRFSGSREKTAGSLGISKATLWRKMKKYQIEDEGDFLESCDKIKK